ncbi:uncharacterized protein LOC124927053 [Impatiens glandulifera]|uniref:uncharacterized protein LOC124927053 n=1 Tax=Impatiens glandulifera TaxID=253017 RepID=UPI001FB0E691|nr:uncharacterized protein LOC124927053 [Impatiens glandulifera]
MACGLRLKVFTPTNPTYEDRFTGICNPNPSPIIRLPGRRTLASVSLQSANTSHFTSTIESSPSPVLQLPQWNPTQHHIVILNAIACAVAISATWLFCSAIPNLLAFKRSAESMEKLLDMTRDELPETMEAIRLSSMEISDLTMELSDLGQEITQGVKSSTRVIHLAEEKLQMLTNTRLPDSKKDMNITTAKRVKEAILKGRSIFQAISAMARFSKVAFFKFGKSASKP